MPDIFTTTEPKEQPEPEQSALPEILPPSVMHIISPHKNSIHGFSAYKEMPMGVTFDTEEDDETILLFLRMHFSTNVPWIFATGILLIAPFLLGYIISISHSPFAFLPSSFLLVVQIFYYLIIAGYVFVNFITWYFNISLITTKRVIDVDFEDLIYKNVAGTKIDLVQDVSFNQIGVISTLFNYGDVLIQTAGAVDNFELKAVPKPERVVQIVEALLGKERTYGP